MVGHMSTHMFIENFASCAINNADGLDTLFLALAPLEYESSLRASERKRLLEFILQIFGLDIGNTVALIEDNVSNVWIR